MSETIKLPRSNPLRGEAEFDYAGKRYRLVLDNMAWIEAEEVLGYSILDVIEELKLALDRGRNPKLRPMAALIYGGMVRQHPELTEEDVVNMIFSGDPEVKRALVDAMRGAQPPEIAEVDEDESPAPGGAEGNGRKRSKGGTGKRSS